MYQMHITPILKFLMQVIFLLLAASVLRMAVAAEANEKVTDTIPLAPGYSGLGYELPAVGSYQLPPLGMAVDGEVLDVDGSATTLHDVMGKKFTLLAFMYSTCSDVNGCPLTSYVFYQIRTAMEKDPELAKNLKLISFSFDPENDTPDVMRLLKNNFNFDDNKSAGWDFLTTKSEQALLPILKSYNQEIQRKISTGGQSSGYSHVLRVFLIDPQKRIRNIYSVAFLHKGILLTDIKTLVEQQAVNSASVTASLSVPGDDKRGYETDQYITNSLPVSTRTGKVAELIKFYEKPPLGLPVISVPADNPITSDKIALGRKLFFDRRLSLNNTFSCAMCHVPEQGFANNELAIAVGIEGRSGRRNTPTIYNSAYSEILFHDGREYTLEQQVWGPLLSRLEMANPSVGEVLKKLSAMPDYDGLFESVFDGRGPTMETVGMALATYQRVLVSGNSPFDKWYYGKNEKAVSAGVKRGFKLFTGKAQCSACHTVGEKSALFMDNRLHNTGLGYRESMGIKAEKERVQLAPGVFVDVDQSIISAVGDDVPSDLGLYEITENPHDRWKFKTPGLRNISLTAPYMHNGAFTSLEQVIDFYDQGGVPNEVLDPLIKPLGLSEKDKQDLIAFLQALTGSNTDTLVSDAFAAPVGDITKADPSWVHGSDVEVK